MGELLTEKQQMLSRYRELVQEITRKSEELERIRAAATQVTQLFTLTPRAKGYGSRVSKGVEGMLDLCQEMDADIAHLVEARREIEKRLSRMEDSTCRLLLEYRYLDGLTWEQVAEQMEYGNTHIFNLHHKALAQF